MALDDNNRSPGNWKEYFNNLPSGDRYFAAEMAHSFSFFDPASGLTWSDLLLEVGTASCCCRICLIPTDNQGKIKLFHHLTIVRNHDSGEEEGENNILLLGVGGLRKTAGIFAIKKTVCLSLTLSRPGKDQQMPLVPTLEDVFKCKTATEFKELTPTEPMPKEFFPFRNFRMIHPGLIDFAGRSDFDASEMAINIIAAINGEDSPGREEAGLPLDAMHVRMTLLWLWAISINKAQSSPHHCDPPDSDTVEERGNDILQLIQGRSSEDTAATKHSPRKKARITPVCRSISNHELRGPLDVKPPKASTPEFVGADTWLASVEVEITACLQRSDDDATDPNGGWNDRIPPMALVRCSRGGKTRALYEIANKMRGYKNAIGSEVACLYVSFNDSTSIEFWEQECPLQALLRRIAFRALPAEATQTKTRTKFTNFLKNKPTWEEESFVEWLGDTPCILLIDEMNNLKELTERNSIEASKFGSFIKANFISKEMRYFVFSSHILATLPFFGAFLDPSMGSTRSTTLQALPLVPSYDIATNLKPTLDSTREAVYYGLVPGMLFESGFKGRNIAGRRGEAAQNMLTNIKSPKEFQHAFLGILKSLLDGNLENVPEELHILLDATPDNDGITHKIRWLPYHLQYVLGRLGASIHDESKLAEKLADLCNLMKESKEQSGEGWESLFVLFLVARCLNKISDEVFIPSEWFDDSPTIVFNGPYSPRKNNNLVIGQCRRLDELKKGLVHGETPQLSIWYPTHNNFEVYDVLAVYSNAGEAQSIYGYQLKEWTARRTHTAHHEVTRSLFIQGNPPKEIILRDSQGWTVPSRSDIDRFFGVSGEHWTPESWKNFNSSRKK